MDKSYPELAHVGWLGQLVRRAVDLGHLREDLDVDQFVWELCGIYLSHHAAHHFLRHPDADARARPAEGKRREGEHES